MDRKEILVRGLKGKGGRVSGYHEYVFYKIDIEKQDSGLVSSTYCPSLFNKHGYLHGKMVKLGSSIIYIIGNNNKNQPKSEEEEEDPSLIDDGVACLKDAGWIDLSEINPKWRSAPCPTHNTWIPQCVPLSGKIYSLGHSRFIPEIYNHPDGACWVELPPPPTELTGPSPRVSFNPIPDPDYDRIIVHINSAVYAFKPNHNQWERLLPLDRAFLYWDKVSVVVDSLVYIAHDGHIHSIAAYDLADSTRELKVEWSNNSTYPDHMRCVEFDDLFNLGNGFLCLAVYTPLHPPPASRVYFVLLSCKRQTPDVVTFTYHYFRSYDLVHTSSVVDFVALGE